MATIKTITRGKNTNGRYTEYSVYGRRDKVVVQSTKWGHTKKKNWGIYRVSPGVHGRVITVGMYPTRKGAEMYAESYINAWRKK